MAVAPQRVLFFGWGAAAAEALRCFDELGPDCEVLCLTHADQAKDVDLGDVCREFKFRCIYQDDPAEVLEIARSFGPDLILSASYRKRIAPDVLNLCSNALNFHPSLLPKHRGCFSSFWVILDGDKETGVTCHRMVDKFDEGLIVHQERLPTTGEDTSYSLYRLLLPITALCVRRVLGMLRNGTLPEGKPQTDEGSYHYRKLPYGGVIQPDWSDQKIARFIRAMTFPGFEGAVAMIDGKKVEVDRVEEYRRLLKDSKSEAAAAASGYAGQAARAAAPQLARRVPKRVLFFGWGAAAAEALRCLDEVLDHDRSVLCLTHPEQAKDVDLEDLCREFRFACDKRDGADEVLERAREFQPELILSVSYRKRIRSEVLELCSDALNFHPSLLPKHRGCMSGFHVIWQGDKETGVTCHRMVENFDEGRVIHQERVAVSEDDNSYTLYRMLLPVTALCVRKVLGMISRGTLPEGTPQIGESSYHYRKLPHDGIIQPEWSDEEVHRYILAMRFPGFEGAAVIIDGKKVFVDSLWEYRWFMGKVAVPRAAAGGLKERRAPSTTAAEQDSVAVTSEGAESASIGGLEHAQVAASGD
eukprot:TRINITY_DN5327_c0_g1_i1.p1 TRINITY_DN5327_c0_g1~~TRINITY_DN5327_c0_g1_i1.p1  ORF type:complete len:586 (+),score=115.75 TRINITY_DN5327_c0_g1_i1:114-1871(+)